MTTATDVLPITGPQAAFLTKLMIERGLDTSTVGRLTKRKASLEIDRVKKLPRTTTRPAQAAAAVAAAKIVNHLEGIPTDAATGVKYMIDGDAGQPLHIQVKSGRGRWSDRVFMDLLIGAPGAWRKQRPTSSQAALWAHRIKTASYTDPVSGEALTGPRAAAVRFSREHKCCAACMSPLSDTTQPGYVQGLGPVCVKKFL